MNISFQICKDHKIRIFTYRKRKSICYAQFFFFSTFGAFKNSRKRFTFWNPQKSLISYHFSAVFDFLFPMILFGFPPIVRIFSTGLSTKM